MMRLTSKTSRLQMWRQWEREVKSHSSTVSDRLTSAKEPGRSPCTKGGTGTTWHSDVWSKTGLTGLQVAPRCLLLDLPSGPHGNVNQPKELVNSEAHRVFTCRNIRASSGWTNGGGCGEANWTETWRELANVTFQWPGHYWSHCNISCNRRTNRILCTVDWTTVWLHYSVVH